MLRHYGAGTHMGQVLTDSEFKTVEVDLPAELYEVMLAEDARRKASLRRIEKRERRKRAKMSADDLMPRKERLERDLSGCHVRIRDAESEKVAMRQRQLADAKKQGAARQATLARMKQLNPKLNFTSPELQKYEFPSGVDPREDALQGHPLAYTNLLAAYNPRDMRVDSLDKAIAEMRGSLGARQAYSKKLVKRTQDKFRPQQPEPIPYDQIPEATMLSTNMHDYFPRTRID